MSDKRVSEMTDDEVRAMAGASAPVADGDSTGPVETLHRIADQDIGGNAPWLADELHGLADRLAASMRGESPESCYFWDIRNGECHFEVLVPGCSPCAACPGGDAPDVARRYSFTRSGLVDALARLEVSVPVSGPAAGKVNAESMADALIEALGSTP